MEGPRHDLGHRRVHPNLAENARGLGGAVLNYFDDRVTNAFSEGITNQIKVIKRCAYDFRNPMRYRSKVLLACGHRRQREVNHRPSR